MAKEAVKITICGKERTVKYPVFALIKLKKDTGIQLKDLQDKDKAEDLETIVSIIWAGLIHEDDSLTVEDVAKDIELDQLEEVAQKVTEVLTKSVKKD